MSDDHKPQRAYRFKDLKAFIPASTTELKHMIQRGEFPAGTPLTSKGKAKVWFDDQIAAFQKQRREAAGKA